MAELSMLADHTELKDDDEASDSKWAGGHPGQVVYSPTESLIAVFARWRGTVLPLVLKNYTFWTLIAIHLMLLVINGYYYELPPMDVSVVIGLPASLLIFLTVFYNGNCYTRYFDLWGHTCELTSIVNNWVLQAAFIFEELDLADGVRDMKVGDDTELADSVWNTARRILASMYMLFMALDSDIEDEDWLGRPTKLPNIMAGEGIDSEEYSIMYKLGLLTNVEIEHIKAYEGFKCQVPIKWALNELRELCKPESRMANQSKNYEAMQEVAANFNKTSVLIVTLMQQPVPFVYFHVLKLMMIIVNSLVAYELVNIFEEYWILSIITFSVVAAMLLGLQEIAGAMADPFGSDDTDFDTHKVCADAYQNAIAYLKTNYPSNLGTEKPIVNPLIMGLPDAVRLPGPTSAAVADAEA